MNFPFEINKVLPEDITKVDNKLQVCRQYGQDRFGYQTLRKMLFEIVDKMGEASAKAQKLPATITSGSKLENSNHHLYIMKDVSGEQSCVIGILKVGTKKLFVYDSTKKQHELEPLCVLDFYVHESRQRMGCGRKLFDFMLASENVPVKQMAVDRPSPKFLSFLKKHFRLHAQIPQVNNYVIFEGFFHSRNDTRGRHSRFTGSGYHGNATNRSRPNSGRKLQTPQSTLHTNHNQQKQPPTPQPLSLQNHGNYPRFSPSDPNHGSRQSPSGMVAGERMYSRHGATPPNPRATPPYRMATPPSANYNQLTNGMAAVEQPSFTHSLSNSSNHKFTKSNGGGHSNDAPQRINDVQEMNSRNNINTRDINYNKIASPYMQYAMGTRNTAPYYDKSHLYRNGGSTLNLAETTHDDSHQPTSAPTLQNGTSGTGSANSFLPDIRSGGSSRQLSHLGPHQKSNSSQLPPSGKRINPTEPPVLQRDGPPAEYRSMLNMHQAYQGRNGRFITTQASPAGGTAISPPANGSPHKLATYEQSYGAGRDNNQDWNWSMSGYLREQHMRQNVSNRYNPGRLW